MDKQDCRISEAQHQRIFELYESNSDKGKVWHSYSTQKVQSETCSE